MNIITDVFSEELRLLSSVKGELPPLERWKQLDVLMFAFKAGINAENTDPYTFRQAIYESKLVKECNLYKACMPVFVAKLFKSKRVLDLSCGWGDRLIGFLAANVDVYDGCDPNPKMQPIYDTICERYKLPHQSVNIQCSTAEAYEVKEGEYDLFHSSPPFYDKECYDGINMGFTSFDDWMERFLLPYVAKGYKGLKKGGYFSIYICDYGRVKMCDKMNDFLVKQLGSTYQGVIGISGKTGEFPLPIWVHRK
jgi:hypothetical protein